PSRDRLRRNQTGVRSCRLLRHGKLLSEWISCRISLLFIVEPEGTWRQPSVCGWSRFLGICTRKEYSLKRPGTLLLPPPQWTPYASASFSQIINIDLRSDAVSVQDVTICLQMVMKMPACRETL